MESILDKMDNVMKNNKVLNSKDTTAEETIEELDNTLKEIKSEMSQRPDFITSNIMETDKALNRIEETLEYIASVLSTTLGPFGSTTIIQDRMLQHTITKDGYNVLKNIDIEEDLPRTVLDIVRKISQTLVRSVGDGSTSSVIIANNLFKSLKELTEKYNVPPKIIVDLLNKSVDIFSEEIKEKRTPITDENFDIIKKIASISTNNDDEAGEMVHEVFGKIGRHGFVNFELADAPEDYYEISNGMEITRGYINQLCTNDDNRKIAEYENPLVFMMNDTMMKEDLELVHQISQLATYEKERPLVLIAPSYSLSAEKFIHENLLNKRKNKFRLVAIDIPYKRQQDKDQFRDLAISLGCTVYDKVAGESFTGKSSIDEYDWDRLGTCKKIESRSNVTKFIEPQGEEEKIEKRVKEIREKLENLKQDDRPFNIDEDIFRAEKRIASLSNSMAIIYVGGNSNSEKETKKHLYEDAVYATRSALEYGYIIGGNLILPMILENDDKFDSIVKSLQEKLPKNFFKNSEKEVGFLEDFLNIINRAFKGSFKAVLKNGMIEKEEADDIIDKCIENEKIYNLRNKEYQDGEEVINSAETDIEIIKSTFSIIGYLVTNGQFITLNKNG
jgi:chaperonin GroEL